MPSKLMQKIFQEFVPQELQHKYFKSGISIELEDYYLKHTGSLFNLETLKTLSEEAKIQGLILLNFTPHFLSDKEIFKLAFSVDIQKRHLRAILPYLQRPAAFIESLEESSKLLIAIKTYANDYLSYFLKYQQIELMEYFQRNHPDLIRQWVELNHEQVLSFCLETRQVDWFDILLPLMNEASFAEYFNIREHLFYEKRGEHHFNFFLRKLTEYHPKWLKDFLCSNQFNYFNVLIQHGSMDLFIFLFIFLEDILQESYPDMDLLKVYLYSRNFRPIHIAAQYGQLDFLDWVEQNKPNELSKILKLSHWLALKIAVAYKHHHLFHFLLSQVMISPQWPSASQEFEGVYFDGTILNIAVGFGNLELLEEIYDLMRLTQEPQQIFFQNQEDLFLSAVEGNQIECLDWLLQKLELEFERPTILNEIVTEYSHAVILEAASGGNTQILDWFARGLDQSVLMDAFPRFRNFFKSENHIDEKLSLPVLNWLETIFGERLQELLKAEQYLSLLQAVKRSQHESFLWILERTQKTLNNLPKGIQEHLLKIALMHENQVFLNFITAQLSTFKIKKLLKTLDDEYLMAFFEKSPSYSLEWLKLSGFSRTLSGMSSSTPKISWCRERLTNLRLEDLKSLSLKELKKLVQFDNMKIFQTCVLKGQLRCLEYLSQKLPDLFEKILIKDASHLIKTALLQQEFGMIDFILRQIKEFDLEFELDVIDCMSMIFVTENIAAVMWSFETGLVNIEQLNDQVFDDLIKQLLMVDSTLILDYMLDDILVRLKQNLPQYFEMMDNHSNVGEKILQVLILDMDIFEAYETFLYRDSRRNYQKIDYLANYVKECLDELIEDACPQLELDRAFRLTRYSILHTRCTQQVIHILQVPSFRENAHQQDNILLRLALKNHEDEIIELLLSIEEVRLLAEQNQFYRHEQTIDVGHESAMGNLSFIERQDLQTVLDHYAPMVKQVGTKVLFNALKSRLVEEYEKNPAKISSSAGKIMLPLTYAQFDDLDIPGHLRLNALKAYYQHKVHTALRFLSNPNDWIHPEIDPQLIEMDSRGRGAAAIHQFIPNIALLYFAAIDEEMKPTDGYSLETRWQNFYLQLALAGRAHNCEKKVRIERADGTQVEAEVDDEEADKPTCARGISKHLSQAVLGHPLFSALNQDLVKQELYAFVYRYYQQKIDEVNAPRYQQAFDDYIEDFNEDAFAYLKRLDIPLAKQEEFLEYMRSQFKSKFTQSYEKIVKDMFKISEKDAHAITFHQKCLQQILDRFLLKRKTEDEQEGPNKRACSR